MTKHAYIACITLALALAACGGGGGGGSRNTPAPAPAPAPPPPVTQELYSIHGAVTVSANLSVDGDTNNPQGVLIPNDTIGTAQAVSNPATIGGYVNQPSEGPEGAVQSSGDIDDYFQVELLAGQTVTMLVADFEQADADLYLYRPDGTIVDFSIEVGQIESLTIPADGTYLVNVFAFSGATNYVLAIGTVNPPSSVATNGLADVIPWQAIVVHSEADSPIGETEARLEKRMGIRAAPGAQRAKMQDARSRRRPALVNMDQRALSEQQQRHRLGRGTNRALDIAEPARRARWETLMTIKALNREPGIASAEPNYRVRAYANPDDDAYSFQWHYPLINLPAAWDLTTGSPDVIVAVVDTGILSAHPDMAGKLVPGYDFIADPRTARDNNGIDPNPEDEGDGAELGSSSFHGTHVSGTVAAGTDNTTGVAGVAWDTRIMPVRVLGVDGGTTYDVRQGVRFAAGLANDSGTVPEQRADIINLSLGGSGFSTTSQALFNEVHAAGVIVVAAAGNEGRSAPSYPAGYDSVISVSAVDIQRQATDYSNFGSTVDVAAPGGDNGLDFNGDGYPDGVLSTGGSVNDNGEVNFVYSFLNGTSMASPHVAGVLALMKSVNPELTPEDIDILLDQGELSDDLGDPGRDDLYGQGLINAQRAVVAALNAAGNPPADNPRLTASTSSLNFGSNADTLELVLQNSGNGELSIVEIQTSETWLSLDDSQTDPAGLGVYRVSVDREGVDSGIYSGEILAISTVNEVRINVIVAVVGAATGGDVGIVYVLLTDAESGESVGQFDASSNDGVYSFEINDLPAGSYELFGGTDADNDLFVCDAGEACGAYLTTDQPVLIELEEDLDSIQFPVEYRVAIPEFTGAGQQSAGDAVELRRNR